MNLPNKLTILRIIMVPFFLFFMLFEGIPYRFLIAGAIFSLAAITDMLDGKIARKTPEELAQEKLRQARKTGPAHCE